LKNINFCHCNLIPVPFFRELTEEEEEIMYSYFMQDNAVAHTKNLKLLQ
jgi:hypothetical protein